MKKVSIAIALLCAAACSKEVVDGPRDWAFMQSVGGIGIGIPTRRSNGWFLPIRADVSGFQSINVKPTEIATGLACKAVDTLVKGDSIYVKVITSKAGPSTSTQCPAAFLGEIASGSYRVFYQEESGNAVPMDGIYLSG